MSIVETILSQIRTNKLGHRKDCTLWTPDVCSCDAYYSNRDRKRKGRVAWGIGIARAGGGRTLPEAQA